MFSFPNENGEFTIHSVEQLNSIFSIPYTSELRKANLNQIVPVFSLNKVSWILNLNFAG